MLRSFINVFMASSKTPFAWATPQLSSQQGLQARLASQTAPGKVQIPLSRAVQIGFARSGGALRAGRGGWAALGHCHSRFF
jgi:hypothetical protein